MTAAVGAAPLRRTDRRPSAPRPAPPEESPETTTTDDRGERKESVRNAWTRTLREEALRMRHPAVSKIAQVGIIMATYADADGSNCWPGVATVASVLGCAPETVTRAVRVLVATGLMTRKRRRGETAVHTLLIPLVPVDWATHLHLYTETRQKARKQRIKQQEVLQRAAAAGHQDDFNPFCAAYWAANPDSDWRPIGMPDWVPPAPVIEEIPSRNGIENPFPTGVQEPVPDGGSATRSRRGFKESGTRSGTGGQPDAERVQEPVPDGGVHVQLLPTAGDPLTDTDMVGPVPQPQVRAGARENNTISIHEQPPAPEAGPGPLHALPGGGRGGGPAGQGPLLLPVPSTPPGPADLTRIADRMSELYGVDIPRRFAAPLALDILGDLVLPDPTGYVLAALDADPGRYRPPLPTTARDRRAAGDS